MSSHGARGLTVGSLRGLPQMPGAASRKATIRAGAAQQLSLPVLGAPELPPSKRGQRCCRSGCAGCPVGEAIRRARAQQSG